MVFEVYNFQNRFYSMIDTWILGESSWPLLRLTDWHLGLNSLIIPPLFVLESFLLIAIAVSSFNLDDNQKRWVVIGICLNRLLLPVLRDFTGGEILKHYTSLKSSNRIDTQVFGSRFTHDGFFKLNYSSINNNWATFKGKESLYDYKVSTDVDLAKLYLEPHMAKFTGETICCLGASPI